MEIGVTEASKQWNLSRQYIYRKIKAGELSRLENGNIETSELLRVFGEPKKTELSTSDSQQTVVSDSQLQQENTLLKNQIQQLEGSLSHAEQVQGRLLDQLECTTQKMLLLIEHKPSTPQKRSIISHIVAALLLVSIALGGFVAYLRLLKY
jgi:uncharacterized protein YlxW (UPF0749 family)